MDGYLKRVYDLLYERYGPQRWWPAKTRLEVALGAILVQSTAWRNAAKALESIREAGVMDISGLGGLTDREIGELVRSSGFYREKGRRVKAFVEHVKERHGGDLDRMLDRDASSLREELLGIYGIGEETADCITLYAAGKPSFVVDEYTRRIMGRLGVGGGALKTYADYQRLFQEALPKDVELFGEYHALLVALGKDVCGKRPDCGRCVLRRMCRVGRKTGL